IKHGANVDFHYPLKDLCRCDSMREFNYLLSRGADVNVIDGNMTGDNETPLTVAARSGQKLKIISLLLLGANPAIEGRFDVHHPREHVARYGQFTALECARIVRERDEELQAYYGRAIQRTKTIESIEALF